MALSRALSALGGAGGRGAAPAEGAALFGGAEQAFAAALQALQSPNAPPLPSAQGGPDSAQSFANALGQTVDDAAPRSADDGAPLGPLGAPPAPGQSAAALLFLADVAAAPTRSVTPGQNLAAPPQGPVATLVAQIPPQGRGALTSPQALPSASLIAPINDSSRLVASPTTLASADALAARSALSGDPAAPVDPATDGEKLDPETVEAVVEAVAEALVADLGGAPAPDQPLRLEAPPASLAQSGDRVDAAPAPVADPPPAEPDLQPRAPALSLGSDAPPVPRADASAPSTAAPSLEPRAEQDSAVPPADPAAARGSQIDAPPLTATNVASSAPAATPAPIPSRITPQAAQGLAAQIVRRADEGQTTFDLRLDPPSLGRVDVRLSISTDRQVEAVIAAERPDALVELQRAARDLETSLRDAGLSLRQDGLRFELGGQGQAFGKQGRDGRGAPATRARGDGADRGPAIAAHLNAPQLLRAARGGLDITA